MDNGMDGVSQTGTVEGDVYLASVTANNKVEADFQQEKRDTESKLDKTLGDIYDKHQSRDSDPAMPAGYRAEAGNNAGDNIDRAVDKTAEWLSLPLSERKEAAAASAEVARWKDEANKLGLTLEQRQALLADQKSQAATAEHAEFAPFMKDLGELYPGQSAKDIAAKYIEVDRQVRKDPVAGMRWLCEMTGVDPRQLVERAQPSGTEWASPTFAQDRETVVAFAQSVPDWEQHQTGVLNALKSGAVARTGNIPGDLRAAYDYAKTQSPPKRSETRRKASPRRASWEDTLERVGQQVTGR